MAERWLQEVLSDAKRAAEKKKSSHKSSSSASASASSSSSSYKPSGSLSSSNSKKIGSASPSTVIPKSVRNAPPDMRLAIRRNQNAESMRRQRAKEKADRQLLSRAVREQRHRMELLSERVHQINAAVERSQR